jgi:hypothetical protein
MQKYKFGGMCPDALIVESIPVPPKNEKLCIDVSHPGCSRMHYVTRMSHRMQKRKLGVTCPDMLFVESISVPPDHENSASMFRAPDTPKCTT